MEHLIERLGHLGDGVAAGPVYVARALPGERVAGEVAGGRIAAPRIVAPVPDRVAPPCPHYKSCGGCALQHAADPFVANWKVDVVRRALAAQGLAAPIRRVHTSPPRSRRRATLSGRRTKKGALVGFHGRASASITAIPECTVLHPDLLAGIGAAEALTLTGASRKGELSVTLTRSDGGLDVAVAGGKPLDRDLRVDLAAIAGSHDLARLVWDGEVVFQARAPMQTFGATQVVPPPGAFLQATAQGEAALLASVRDAVGSAGRIADLFAGCGTFALPLVDGSEVHAVEGAGDMVAAMEQGWRHGTGLKRLSVEARDLFRRPLLADELSGFDAVVIDPPRAGAETQMAQIAASGVPVVAAVSCNPASFARDARTLCAAGFGIEWVDVVDQFRWSPHVELAALLTRGHMKPGR